MKELQGNGSVPTIKRSKNGESSIDNLDKVREILIGSQIKNLEARFDRKFDLLKSEIENKTIELGKMIESVKNDISNDALDRAQLAKVFSDMALQLNDIKRARASKS